MAIRIKDPCIDDTSKLLEQVLLVVVRDESRALFLVPAGMGEAVVQRLRMQISRTRKKLEAKGKKPAQFRMRDSIHPETHNGQRFDACIMWKDVNESHIMREELERLMSNG